jgi:hypothetical protein
MGDPKPTERSQFESIFATPEERAVFASLSDEEITVLVAVRKRITEVAGDVEVHLMGATFW